jgi:hypothetical protein
MVVIPFQEGYKLERVMGAQYCFEPWIRAVLHETKFSGPDILPYFQIVSVYILPLGCNTKLPYIPL